MHDNTLIIYAQILTNYHNKYSTHVENAQECHFLTIKKQRKTTPQGGGIGVYVGGILVWGVLIEIWLYMCIHRGSKKRSERFSYVSCADVFPTFLSPCFLRFSILFFLRFVLVSLRFLHWLANTGKLPSSDLLEASRLAPQKSHSFAPTFFLRFFSRFLYVFLP